MGPNWDKPEPKGYLDAWQSLREASDSGDPVRYLRCLKQVSLWRPDFASKCKGTYITCCVAAGKDEDALDFAQQHHLFEQMANPPQKLIPGDYASGEFIEIRRALGLALARMKRYDLSRSYWDDSLGPMRRIDMLPYLPRKVKDSDLAQLWMLALTKDGTFGNLFKKKLAQAYPENAVYQYRYECGKAKQKPELVDKLILEFIPKTRGHFRVFLERCAGEGNPQRTEVILKTIGLTPTVLKPGED